MVKITIISNEKWSFLKNPITPNLFYLLCLKQTYFGSVFQQLK